MNLSAQYTILYNDASGNPLTTDDVNTCQSFNEINSARVVIITDAADNTELTLTMPGGVNYIDGSVTVISSTGGLSIVQNTFDSVNPVFTITPSNLNSGDEITFSWAREADCAAVDYQMSGGTFKDILEVSGDDGTILENNMSLNTYDLLVPSLSLFGEGPATANIGSTVMREITITNGGEGMLNSFTFYIIDGSGTSTTTLETNGGTAIPPSGIANDTFYYTIGGAILEEFGNGDQFFDNGEQILLRRTFDVLSCDNDSYFGAYWGCSDKCMETDAILQSTIIPNLVPNLTFEFKDGVNEDFCYNGDNAASDGVAVMQEFEFCNTGNGPATNIELDLYNSTPGSGTGQNYFSLDPIDVFDENGNLIGSSVSQTNISSLSQYRQNDCSLESYPRNIRYDLGELVLMPAECITIEVPTYVNNLEEGCVGRCNGDIAWYYFNRAYRYQDQCEQINYDLPRRGIGFGGRQLVRFDLEMPTDLVDQQEFDLEINFAVWHTQVKNNNEGFTCLFIDLSNTGLVYIGPNTVFFDGSNADANLDVQVIGDSIKYTLPNTVLGSGVLEVPLRATCEAGGGALTLDLFHQGQYDDSCSELPYHHNCLSRTFQMHCPEPCPEGGATPIAFNLERVSLGLADVDNNGVPDGTGTADPSDVRLHRASNCDTVRGAWELVVYPNTVGPNAGNPFNHTYLEFDLDNRDATCNDQSYDNTFTPIPNALVTVFPGDGSPEYTCQITPSILGPSDDRAIYDLTPCKTTWAGGDSIYVEAFFVVNASTGSGGFRQYVSDNEVYSSFVPNPADSYNDRDTNPDGERYTCDRFNDYMNVYNHYSSPWFPNPQIIMGCEGSIRMDYRYYINIQTGDIWYPNEYRNFTYPDEFIVNWPDEFPYRPGSAQFSGNIIPDADITQGGGQLIFSNLRQFFQSNGGPLLEPDEAWSYSVTFQLDANCDLPAGSFNPSFTAMQIGNGCQSGAEPFPSWSNCNGRRSSTTSVFYERPQPFITGGGQVQYTAKDVCWDVILNNGSNNVDAPESWFYFEILQGDILDIEVFDNGGNALIENNGIFEVGDNAAGSSSTYSVCATPANCDSLELEVYTGFGCDGYPSRFDGLSCGIDTLLGIPHRSEVQLRVNSEPIIPMPLCTEQEIELQVSSAQAAYLDEASLDILLPSGTFITSQITLEYPAGSGNIENAVFTQSGTLYSLDLEAHSLIDDDGIPGTIDALIPEEREVLVRFSVNTDCDFTSGTGIVFQAFGNRPCGDPAINNGVRARTSDLSVSAADLPFASSIDIDFATGPKLMGCEGTEVMVNMEFVGLSADQTTDQDSIFVLLDAGVEYQSGSVTCCSSDPSTCLQFVGEALLPSGQSRLSFAMPNGGIDLTTAKQSCFRFDIANAPDGTCDIIRALTVEAVGNIAGVSCPTEPSGICPSLKILTGQETIEFETEKTELSLITSTLECTRISKEVDYSLEVQLDSMALMEGNMIVVDVFCADATGMTSNYIQSEVIDGPIGEGRIVQLSGSFDGNLCNLANGFIVQITAMSDNGNNNCICDEIMIPSGLIECPECPDPNCFNVNIKFNVNE